MVASSLGYARTLTRRFWNICRFVWATSWLVVDVETFEDDAIGLRPDVGMNEVLGERLDGCLKLATFITNTFVHVLNARV